MIELPSYEIEVKDDWLDVYGHLNEGYYLVAFSEASWHVGDPLGVGVAYTEHTGFAFYTTGGITFSFGGLKIDAEARVLDTSWQPIGGLYCAGEMVGNLFHDNYPGGSGLPSGAVFGRIAGRSAAHGVNR